MRNIVYFKCKDMFSSKKKKKKKKKINDSGRVYTANRFRIFSKSLEVSVCPPSSQLIRKQSNPSQIRIPHLPKKKKKIKTHVRASIG